MEKNKKINKPNNRLLELIIEKGLFDLQFRRDVRYERLNHPTYYRWKAQFIIVLNKSEEKDIKAIKNVFGCGRVYLEKNQIRYAVQNINDLKYTIIPFFEGKKMKERKKNKLISWAKAIEIIYNYKRKNLSTWQKKDFKDLLDIYKLIQESKNPHRHKWISGAELILKTLK